MIFKGLILLLLTFYLSSCASKPFKRPIPQDYNNYLDSLEASPGNTKSTNIQKDLPMDLNLKPTFKDISPLDKEKVNISVVKEDYEKVLILLAQMAGLNLIISDEAKEAIPPEKRLISISLNNLSLRQAIQTICDLLDLSYEIKNGILFIKAFDEKTFDLNFINTLRGTSYQLGGDVLGNIGGSNGDEENVISPLKGKIEIKGDYNSQESDIYKSIEENIKKIISKKGTYLLNKQTGILFIRDYVKNIKLASSFIKQIKEKYNKQILIEAKIIEVNLNKKKQFGINWQAILQNDLKDTVNLSSTGSFLWNNSNTFIINFRATPYFDSILRAIEKYGQIKIISNPRIRVLNTQPALIGIGKSISYIKEIKKETTASEGITTTQTTVESSAIFDGLLFKVTPYIDNKNEITLNIVPIKSDIIALNKAQIEEYEITLPEVNLRETNTVIRLKNNEMAIISGLIMNKDSKENLEVPGISKVPLLGHLFKSKNEATNKVELIILLKAKII